MNSRIPQLLVPYVENVPKDGLLLFTSTLSNNVNWLIVRHLCGAFSNDVVKVRRTAPQQEELGDVTTAATDELGVVLVSWMRDFEFWRTEARRAAGLDLASLSQSRKFAFVDGLMASSPPPTTARHVPALSSGAIPIRGPAPGTLRSQTSIGSPTPSAPTPAATRTRSVPSIELSRAHQPIEDALSSLNTSSVLLILDAPDVLLALQDPITAPSNTTLSSALETLIFTLRLHPRVHATIISLSSDINPLPSARQDQHIPLPLEVESQALLVGVAHTADLVISARGLDTGAAGDVGGILRITKGQDEAGTSRAAWPEQELLYLVKTDGSAKVWERGAGVGVG